MTPAEFRALALSFPGVEEGTSWGQPSFKAHGKFLTRVRSEDDSAVFLEVGFDEREMLLEAEPETFHITDHYKGYPSVLARLAALDEPTARALIERRWRKLTPKTVQKLWDAGRSA